MKKVAEITLAFWLMKICATTLGETAGDLMSMTLKIGYAASSIILLGFFIITLIIQLRSSKFHPVIFWMVIISTSTAGTIISDYMDRSLNLGYAAGSFILVSLLILTLSAWWLIEKSLSVTDIKTFRPELFYWITILFSNTLGTALGDYLADTSGLGFLGGALLIGGLLILLVLAYYFTRLSRVILFWIAFVLTRPFGATFGDLLTKPFEKGGLNFGTIGSSLVLSSALIIMIFLSVRKQQRENVQ